MTEFEQIIAEERAALEDTLDQLGVKDEMMRVEAAKTVDLAAKIMADKLAGQDTTLAEASLRARYANLRSATSSIIAGTIVGALEGMLLRMARRITMILFAV